MEWIVAGPRGLFGWMAARPTWVRYGALGVVATSYAIILWQVFQLQAHDPSGLGIPDAWFRSRSSFQVHDWLFGLGDTGRAIHRRIAQLDLVFFGPGHTLALGVVLYNMLNRMEEQQTRRKAPWILLQLPLLACTADWVETSLYYQANMGFPNRMDEKWIRIASLSTKLKYGVLLSMIFWMGVVWKETRHTNKRKD